MLLFIYLFYFGTRVWENKPRLPFGCAVCYRATSLNGPPVARSLEEG